MSEIGKPERETQRRVVQLFREELGYTYLGDWEDRAGNSNIEQELLSAYLKKAGYSDQEISGAIRKLTVEAGNKSRGLYQNNHEVYKLLRYGVGVKEQAGRSTETVKLINWDEPEQNDFAIAEEVTITGDQTRRPDVVLYINGIAFGLLELKNSRVSIGNGIRQSLSNQQEEFNAWFFTTVQFIFAGNDTEGLRYGTIGTAEKFFLTWKEDKQEDDRFKIDKYLLKMCEKKRICELMYDFVVFDAGVKKLPRVHQYFGMKEAQKHVEKSQGGIIWHTQGSGKSIVMVFLAKWILENYADARVLVITDRDSLDKQILGVLRDAGALSKEKENSFYNASSTKDLMSKLSEYSPRLICSLVHKFGLEESKKQKTEKEFKAYIEQLQKEPKKVAGKLFVFVDECHRTQSGRLHTLMKTIMPDAVFIGFTGTPLLKKDKKTSLEVFGGYIHTYKFQEAVNDDVVLDLSYEARDVDQELGSQDKIDTWFNAKTKGLNDWQKDELKKKWGTLQKVLSSRSRMGRIISDIIFDFNTKPRLISERGNAMLVASSIYEACKYYELLQKTPFKGKCAVITSYNPQTKNVTLEETGANTETEKQAVYNIYSELLEEVTADAGMTKTETYEEHAKKLFTEEPARMKLLVVVDKLLTGFDAPSCTYLYIDKTMQDHGLFQAICRTNRLDGDDKDFGYIVDYKDLFKKLVNDKGTGALQVYTSELDDPGDGAKPEVLMQDRLEKGREKLDNTLEKLELLCEHVEPPKDELQHIRYFCGNTEITEDLKEREPRREALYKATVSFVRAYGNLADEMDEAGYGDKDRTRIKQRLDHFVKLRDTIRLAAGEVLDLKPYEADMRHLLDTYIEASEPRKISPFDEIGLLDLIVKIGIDDAVGTKFGNLKDNQDAVAETIENNVRKTITKEKMSDPLFYEKMSALLKEVIDARKARAIKYEEYLKQIADLVKKLQTGRLEDTPETLDTPGKRALFNMLKMIEQEAGNPDPDLDALADTAVAIHKAILRSRPDNWRGTQAKEQVIKKAIYQVLPDEQRVERLFQIIAAQREY